MARQAPKAMVRLSGRQLNQKRRFIQNYMAASNAADGSTFDPNSNVTSKNVATMAAELNKDINIQVKRALVYDRMKNLFNRRLADKYIDQLEKHEIYCHDETGIMPYCVAVSMYPFLMNGLQNFGGDSKAPQHLSSFNGGFINLVFALSSQFCGAVATVEYLMCFDYFARKDYGEHYLTDYVSLIEQELQQVVYALNQPASARSFQCPFWNISIFDKHYFESLFGSFCFPDGSKPSWESVDKLQKFFLKWFNKERTKALLTFPVVTVSMLNDGEAYKDKDYADFIAKELSEGNSFFIYTSDTVDSLSSCCFSGDTKVLWKNSYDGVKCTTFKELYDLKWDPYKKNLNIFHNGSWVDGKVIRLPNRPMYKVVTTNNKTVLMSDNHLNVTYDGEKTTSQLTADDYLMFNTRPLQAIPEYDQKLSYEQGFVIGAFLGNGSMSPAVNGTVYDIVFSMNASNAPRLVPMLNAANMQTGGSNECVLAKMYNNNLPVRICSKQLAAFIMEWTNWFKGVKCNDKGLNLNCLLQSYDFRKGILDGWYDTDGGNSNRCYTTSKQLAEDMEVLCTSLGIPCIVDISDKTDEKVIIRNEEYNRNYPLYCLRFYNTGNKRTMGDIYKIKNNSVFFRIKSIESVEYNEDSIYCIERKNQDEPYFTLPNGLITHNCRLRSGVADQINDFSYSLGAGGVMTGSMNVITLNANRLIQNTLDKELYEEEKHLPLILDAFKKQARLIHKYQLGFKTLFEEFQKGGLMPAYDSGFITLNKQYVTVGINGLVEGAEYLGYQADNNPAYKDFISQVMKAIADQNKESAKEYNIKINTELVPAENLGVKFAKWDRKDGYVVTRDCYNSYLYPVEDESITVIDKFILHGNDTTKFLDGGSALHLNLEDIPDKTTCRKILDIAVKTGCPYFCINVKVTVCNECGFIDKHTLKKCSKCGSKNVDYATRIIGYLRKITNFSSERQQEESKRHYHIIQKDA